MDTKLQELMLAPETQEGLQALADTIRLGFKAASDISATIEALGKRMVADLGISPQKVAEIADFVRDATKGWEQDFFHIGEESERQLHEAMDFGGHLDIPADTLPQAAQPIGSFDLGVALPRLHGYDMPEFEFRSDTTRLDVMEARVEYLMGRLPPEENELN